MKGQIVKGIGGFFYVNGRLGIERCKGRGILKQQGTKPLVGDFVRWTKEEQGDSMIEEVLQRKNQFVRPPISNVDQMIIVMALKEPDPKWSIVDKFLMEGERQNVELILCINKVDFSEENLIKQIKNIYGSLYPTCFVSGKTGEGLSQLLPLLKGKVSAFAGPSGVGKSTIINQLHKDIQMETGSISEKTKRGKHTTRHVELFSIDEETKIFDTPGFTAFDNINAGEERLDLLFPEMVAHLGECKYDNCKHLREPGCKIIEELEKGNIQESRYRAYKEAILEREKNWKY